MGRFRKVSETLQSTIADKAFFAPEQTFEEYDPFAQLREGAAQRRQALARELRYNDEPELTQPAWEQARGAETYERPDIRNVLNQKVSAVDLSGTAIRRIGADVESSDSARDIEMMRRASVTLESSLSLMAGGGIGVGGSFYDPEIQRILREEAEAKKAMFVNRQAQARKLADRNRDWEQEKRTEMGVDDRRATVSARAHPILRTAHEMSVDSPIGLPNLDAVIERERMLQQQAEAKATRSASIKRDVTAKQSDQEQRQANAMRVHSLSSDNEIPWLDLAQE